MTFLADLKYTARLMRRRPGFTAVALLTLALGIGANTAIFSAVDAVLLRPLPFKDPASLVMVWEDASAIGFPQNNFSPANWVDVRRRNRVFEDIATSRNSRANLTADGAPELVTGLLVSANLFSVLRVQPAVGRAFSDEEDRAGAAVTVISHSLWQRRYGGDRAIIGKPIFMDGQKVQVVGIMPATFSYLSREIEFWRPISFTPENLAQRGSHFLICVARLKPGVTVDQARSDVTAIFKQLDKEYQNVGGVGGVIVPITEQMIGDTRTALIVLLSASGAVLLLACANLASLLIARAIGRTREVAVRTALGAGRGRLLRQMLTESIVVTIIGGALGLIVASWGKLVLERAVPTGMAFSTLELDWRAIAFASALSIATGAVFGALPALWTLWVPVSDALKQGTRSSTSTSGKMLGDMLIVCEIAASIVLLVGAGLMIQTLAKLYSVDVGFRAGHLLTGVTSPSAARYKTGSERYGFYERVIEKVNAIPGVRGAAYSSMLPFVSRGNTTSYNVPGKVTEDDVMVRIATNDYLSTVLGAKLRYGRFFGTQDGANTQLVVIINSLMAQRFWPGRNPVGEKIQVPGGDTNENWRTVVGVVEDVKERGFDIGMKIAAYIPAAQETRFMQPTFLAIRTDVDPMSIASAVRAAVWAVDPEQPVYRLRPMEEIVSAQIENRSLQRTLLVVFAGLALFIASVGLYGVLSYRVTNRTREIGVRVALGATSTRVARMIMGQGIALTGIGLITGVLASAALARLIETQLYGVKPTDAITYTAVAATVVVVALLACYIPARRASRVDPVVALRDE
jgi:predicted permease